MVEQCGTRAAVTAPAPGHQASTPTRPALVAGHSLMQVEVCTITPEKAAELLKANTANRPLKQLHIAFFENQLRRGEMQLTHQGIAISVSGRLLDGQHRLTAIVNTGIEARLLVATGLPDSSFAVLDTGTARTAADVFSIDNVHHASCLATGIRLYLFYKEIPSVMWSGKSSKIASTTVIRQKYFLDPEGWQWSAKLASHSFVPRLLTPGPTAAFIYLASRDSAYSRDYLTDFLYQTKEGIDLPYGSPILAYRKTTFNGLVNGKVQQSRLADLIKLFNAYTTGQNLKQFKSQSFPPMPSLVHASESIHENACA
jgi:hypothetical protein